MRLLIVLVLGLALGAVAYFLGGADSNMINIRAFTYDIELPVLLFVPGLIIALLLLYLAINYIEALFRAPRNIRQWKQKRNAKKAQLGTMQGFANLIEGDWEQAEDSLLTKISENESALINYLGLAYSAQQRKMHNRRDIYIKEALRRFPKQKNAIDLTHARLQYQSGEYEKAQEKLENIVDKAPKNKAAIRLLTDVYEKTENYQALMQTLPKAKKLNALTQSEISQKEQLTYQGVLANPALEVDDKGSVTDAWQALPRKAKKNAGAVYAHAQGLMTENKHAQAEKVVRKALNREYDAELALLYGQIETDNTANQVKTVMSWMNKKHDSQELKLTLARLNRRNENIDEAQSLFQSLIQEDSYLRTEACSELGAMLEQIGEKDAALLCYKNGLTGANESNYAQLSDDSAKPNSTLHSEDDAITVPVLDTAEDQQKDQNTTDKTDVNQHK